MRAADLHMHTEPSDGTDGIEERIEQGEENGLDAIVLTDHDVIHLELDGRVYVDKETGVEVITGVEIKCEVQDTGIEILAYFLDSEAKEIKDLLDQNSRIREQRIREMIGNLNQVLDHELTEEEVFDEREGNPGRPQIADALHEAGFVENQTAAFEEYIGENCEAYIPTPKQHAEKVIETVLEDGAIPVLAHPGRDLEESEAEDIVEELAGYWYKGLEVKFNWEHKIENGFDVNFAEDNCRELAENTGLIRKGGLTATVQEVKST